MTFSKNDPVKTIGEYITPKNKIAVKLPINCNNSEKPGKVLLKQFYGELETFQFTRIESVR